MGGNIFGNGYSMGLAGEGAETAGPGVTKKIMYTFTGYEVISCSCISCHHYIIWVLSVNHTSVRTRASGVLARGQWQGHKVGFKSSYDTINCELDFCIICDHHSRCLEIRDVEVTPLLHNCRLV